MKTNKKEEKIKLFKGKSKAGESAPVKVSPLSARSYWTDGGVNRRFINLFSFCHVVVVFGVLFACCLSHVNKNLMCCLCAECAIHGRSDSSPPLKCRWCDNV